MGWLQKKKSSVCITLTVHVKDRDPIWIQVSEALSNDKDLKIYVNKKGIHLYSPVGTKAQLVKTITILQFYLCHSPVE